MPFLTVGWRQVRKGGPSTFPVPLEFQHPVKQVLAANVPHPSLKVGFGNIDNVHSLLGPSNSSKFLYVGKANTTTLTNLASLTSLHLQLYHYY